MEKEFFKVGADGQYEIPITPDKELFTSNYMNEVGFKGFTSLELDVFYSLCAVFSNTEDRIYRLNLDEFFKSMKKRGYSIEESYKIVDDMTDKLTDKKVFKDEKGNKIKGSLFVTSEDESYGYIDVEVPRLMRHLINDLHGNFTKIEMAEFLGLRSVNAKKLYRLFQQYDDKGIIRITVDDFRSVMGISETTEIKYIKRDVITPAIKELGEIYTDIKFNENRNMRKKGRPITSFTFSWIPRRNIIDEKAELDKKKTQRVNKAKAILKESGEELPIKKNSFTNFEERKYQFDENGMPIIED